MAFLNNVREDNLHKALMPGMQSYAKTLCEAQVREQIEPIIKTIADEMFKRFQHTVQRINEPFSDSCRFYLTINYNDEEIRGDCANALSNP